MPSATSRKPDHLATEGKIQASAAADRAYFAAGYYAAKVADFDGNRLEFVQKAWNPKR